MDALDENSSVEYHELRSLIKHKDARRRAVRNLIRLRGQLDGTIPAKDAEDNLLLATWNVRDLGKKNRRGWGGRLTESLFYIAEVISRFDFVAVQEVNRLAEWEKIMRILGHNWAYIATDETDPAIGGNGERMTFVYDKRKVRFQSIAGEIVLPASMLISQAEFEVAGRGRNKQKKKKIIAGNQFKRTPFLAMFQSGWLEFDICTVHLYYGASSGPKLDARVEEIRTISKYLGERADRALGDDRALIILGDFNIVHPEHKTMRALTDHGFVVPTALQDRATTGSNKHYDQIGFKTKLDLVEYVEVESDDPLQRNAGVVRLFEKVFSDRQFRSYKEIVRTKSTAGRKAQDDTELRKAYKQWRTYQFSDHYPMWVRLKTDGSAKFLERMVKQ